MMNLPQNYLDEMKELLGEDYDRFLASYDRAPRPGLRIHTGKLAAGKARELLPFHLEPVPWISNGYYYGAEDIPSRHPYYFAGLYYLQEPSAMTPASLLPVHPGDKVLDLCAAPGGKATELGVRLRGEGVLFANDISNSRAKALLKNLELFGIPNMFVTSEDPGRLLEKFPEYFDKILIDAPCSGEGMFRKDPKMIAGFEERGPEYYAGIQKQLVLQAADMLKSGGMLLYSTCTFSRKENEDVISFLLKEREDFDVICVPRYEGFSDGLGEGSIKNCVRIWPHRMGGEGHFAALLQKKPHRQENEDCKGALPLKETGRPGKQAKAGKLPEAAANFLSRVSLPFSSTPIADGTILTKDDRLYLIPDQALVLPGIRYLRTGLYLGDMIKGRMFEPSQALAQALTAEGFDSCISFSAEDIRTIKYLKGETLEIGDLAAGNAKGWQLVCVDGWPLGWGKANGGTLKNKYYSGWRWQ